MLRLVYSNPNKPSLVTRSGSPTRSPNNYSVRSLAFAERFERLIVIHPSAARVIEALVMSMLTRGES